MYFILTLFIFSLSMLHFRKTRKSTQILLLPSNLHVLLEFILQNLLPIFLIQQVIYEPYFPLAFFIMSIGILFFLTSYHFTNFFFQKGLARRNKTEFSNTWLELDPFFEKANFYLVILGIGCIFGTFLLTGVIPIFEKNRNDARFFFFNPSYFALYKYFYWFGITVLSICGINAFLLALKQNKKKQFYIVFAGCALSLLFTAHRGPLFAMLIAIYALYYQFHPLKLNWPKFLLHIIVAFGLSMIALFFREGKGDLTTWILSALTSGSSFVDFIEFVEALELTSNQEYLHGKTYLGDLLGFIPYGKWEFRDLWRFKEWTKELFRVPIESGGFRLTMFGEPYFNFGFFGIAIQSILAGYFFCLFDNIIIAAYNLYKEQTPFSVARFLFKHTLFFAITSTICGFYNILFYLAALAGILLFLFFTLILRSILLRKPWPSTSN